MSTLLQISSIARTANRSATGAAAYRAGEQIRDERTGELHNHSRRTDVTHKEILLPAHLAAKSLDWARDRASLWNAVERAEARKNARVASEILVMLPAELPAARRLEMARALSQEVADHYKVVVDLAVHDPRSSADPRYFHAHLLMSTREITSTGFGAKTGLDLDPRTRIRLGLPNASQQFAAIRERWAALSNEALREANLDAGVDRRSTPIPAVPISLEDLRREARENWLRSIAAARTERSTSQHDQHTDRGADLDHLP